MIEQRRYHIIIEQKVDIFVQVCQKYIKLTSLEKKVWVTKDEMASLVGIGDPDKIVSSKDYGFAVYYEAILDDFGAAVELFRFKLNHFIKTAQTTNRFQVFKNGKKEQSNQEDTKS
jgi:hypothetical protein